jgi:hypothetical protein
VVLIGVLGSDLKGRNSAERSEAIKLGISPVGVDGADEDEAQPWSFSVSSAAA